MLWESKFAQINLNEGVEFFVAFFFVGELSLTHLWVAMPKKKKKKQKHLLFLRKLIPACVCAPGLKMKMEFWGRQRRLKTRMSNFPIFVSHLQLIWKMDFLCLPSLCLRLRLAGGCLRICFVSFKFRLFTHFKLHSLCQCVCEVGKIICERSDTYLKGREESN